MCSTISLVSCHRPRSVWVCVLCPAPVGGTVGCVGLRPAHLRLCACRERASTDLWAISLSLYRHQAGHGRAHGRTLVTTPRHACPAVGGPETRKARGWAAWQRIVTRRSSRRYSDAFEFCRGFLLARRSSPSWSSDPSLPAAASGCLIPPLAVQVQDVLVRRPHGPVRLQKVRPSDDPGWSAHRHGEV